MSNPIPPRFKLEILQLSEKSYTGLLEMNFKPYFCYNIGFVFFFKQNLLRKEMHLTINITVI